MSRVSTYITGVISVCLLSTSALAYYQDRFNPNSSTYNARNVSNEQPIRVYDDGGNSWQAAATNQSTVSNKKHHSHHGRVHAQRERRSASFPAQREATGRRVFIYDPHQLSWAAYDSNGKLVRTGPGSGGRSYCEDLGRGCHTVSGVFSVFDKEGAGYKSKRFPLPHGGAPMMYAMFFHRAGYAIHGSNDVPGYNASHGCVRVLPSDARWLNQDFLSYGSTVIIRPY